MRLKHLLVSIASVLISLQAFAAGPVRMRLGTDWGYSPLLFQSFVSTYYTRIGYRVTEQSRGFDYYTNGYLLFGFGCEVNRRCAFYVKTGYMGLFEDFRVMPILCEAQYFFNGSKEGDCPFVMLNGGVALNSGSFIDNTILASLGGGYRHYLSGTTSLDIVARIQASNCTPQPYDKYDGLVPRSRIIFSNAHQFALSLGLSLYF